MFLKLKNYTPILLGSLVLVLLSIVIFFVSVPTGRVETLDKVPASPRATELAQEMQEGSAINREKIRELEEELERSTKLIYEEYQKKQYQTSMSEKVSKLRKHSYIWIALLWFFIYFFYRKQPYEWSVALIFPVAFFLWGDIFDMINLSSIILVVIFTYYLKIKRRI